MAAKYESHCCLCDWAIRKGNTIRLESGEPTVHATCHEIMLEGKSTESQIASWTAALAKKSAKSAPAVAGRVSGLSYHEGNERSTGSGPEDC